MLKCFKHLSLVSTVCHHSVYCLQGKSARIHDLFRQRTWTKVNRNLMTFILHVFLNYFYFYSDLISLTSTMMLATMRLSSPISPGITLSTWLSSCSVSARSGKGVPPIVLYKMLSLLVHCITWLWIDYIKWAIVSSFIQVSIIIAEDSLNTEQSNNCKSLIMKPQ